MDILKRPQKCETIFHLIWQLLSKRQIMWDMGLNSVAFLENLNFSRNLNFQEKLQNGLCSCTSWSNVWHTIEMFDTYPESSWYKLLENTRKSWNNQKSYFTILDKNMQKRILCISRISFWFSQQYYRFCNNFPYFLIS